MPERKLMSEFLGDHEAMAASAENLVSGTAGLWFQVEPSFDLYPYMCETTSRYRLGNLKREGLAHCVEFFEDDRTRGFQAMLHVPVSQLARRFGRPHGWLLHHPWDLRARGASMWKDAESGSTALGPCAGQRSSRGGRGRC